MFIHIFGFRWKPRGHRGRQSPRSAGHTGLSWPRPGLIDAHVGPNVSPRGQGYTFAGLMTFTDKAASDAYTNHPAHLALLQWLRPLIDPVELDFEA